MSLANLSNNQKGIYLTALIYPLWALFLSVKHFRLPQSKNLFWLFCIFLGMIHIFFPEGGSDADGLRYAEQLIELNQQPVTWENFTSFFYEDREFVDIYQPTVTYFLSLITNNPRWLFFVFAFVFGFFYSRNIWFVLEKFPEVIGMSLYILTFYYILICPIWQINGVRMWTALHVFVYGALPYLYNSDKSKLVWCFASLLFHFSFFIPLCILLMYWFIPKKINYLLFFYMISFLIKEIDIEQIRNIALTYSPSFLTAKAMSYTNEEYIQRVIDERSQYNFYVEGSQVIVKWVITVLLFTACLLGRKILQYHKSLFRLFCFALFLYSISNIMSLIPSGGRFIVLSQTFAFVSVIIFYIYYLRSEYQQKYIYFIFKLTPVLLLFPIIFLLRTGCDYYGLSLFLNPLAVLFIEDNQPVIQFAKSIF